MQNQPLHILGNLILNIKTVLKVGVSDYWSVNTIEVDDSWSPSVSGNSYFFPGCRLEDPSEESGYRALFQDIDLSSFDVFIASGNFQLFFSGYYHSYFQEPQDVGRFSFEFYDIDDNILSSESSNIMNYSTWIEYIHYLSVPINSKKIRILLEGYAINGNSIDAYFDDLVLRDILLPVDFISIELKSNDQSTDKLSWITSNDINHKGFEIEISTDGIIWNSVGWIENNTTTLKSRQYEYFLNKTFNLNYYRVVQYDKDGKKVYSEILRQFPAEKESVLNLYPNPVYNELNIQSAEQIKKVEIFNVEGKLVKQEKNHQNQLRLNISNFAKGIYTVKIHLNNRSYSRKIIKL